MENKEQHLKGIFEKSSIGILFYDKEGELVYANQSALDIERISQFQDIKGTNLFINPDIEIRRKKLLKEGIINFQSSRNLYKANEHGFYTSTNFGTIYIDYTISVNDFGFLVQIQDITNTKRFENVMLARFRLIEFANSHSIEELLTATLDEIESLTESTVSFYHFLKSDQKTLTLENWSTNTLKSMCSADGKGRHYDIDQAGVWVDCVYERRPVIHNDYESLPHRKGLPEGHAPVIRELVVPIFRGKLIKAIIGVGNKPENYDRKDIEIISQLGDLSWDIVENKIAEEKIHMLANVVESSDDAIIFKSLEGRILSWNKGAEEIYGYSAEEVLGEDISILAPPQLTDEVKLLIEKIKKGEHILHYETIRIRKDNEKIYVSLTLSPIFDTTKNLSGISTIARDITKRKIIEEELRKAHIHLEEQVEKRTKELKNAYEELEKREKRFSSLIAASSEVLYRASPDWSKMCQFTSHGFLAKMEKPSRTWFQDYIPSEDQPRVTAAFHKAIQTKSVYELEHPIKLADGSVGWIFSRAIPIIDKKGEIVEWFGAASDITEGKKAENALKESEKRYRSIIDNIPDAYFRGNNEGVITMASPSTARMYGFDTPQEMIGIPNISLYKNSEDRYSVLEELKKNGKVEDYEFEAVKRDGTTFWVSLNAQYHYNEDNQIQGTEAFLRDITKRKRAEMKLKKALNDVKRSNEELEQFAYVASHDLQEPLRTIASFTQLLERRYKGKLDPDADEFMAYIVDAAVRMKQQIQDLLEYSRVATSRGKFEHIDMNFILNQATANLKGAIDENNAEITHESLPTVTGDTSQLIRVFQNIIGNAIKYRKPDEPPKIHISTHEDKEKQEYIFSVSDNGIGIKKEYLNRIFGVFQRLHTMDEYKGTGIGLSIVKKVIERHGGKMWVESEFGKGSTFYFTILND